MYILLYNKSIESIKKKWAAGWQKERMKSWEALDAEPKPSWETWKRILRMPHIDHDPKRAKEQWDKVLENNAKKNKKVLDSIIFKV